MGNQPIVFSQLNSDQANQVATYHSARGAAVIVAPDGAGTFTVTITYPDASVGPVAGGEPPATGGSAGSLWQQLATSYKAYRGASDSLKVASLAQWVLESGRGTSPLAVQHLNFGGIKYRDRMAGFAVPVSYTGTDGETTAYCKFASLDAFFHGY